MALYQEDAFEHPDRIAYCMHCDGSFKAREMVMKEAFTAECPLWVRDVRKGELVKCNGGFWDLFWEPWWRDDWICERCRQDPKVCECKEGPLFPQKYR